MISRVPQGLTFKMPCSAHSTYLCGCQKKQWLLPYTALILECVYCAARLEILSIIQVFKGIKSFGLIQAVTLTVLRTVNEIISLSTCV